MSKRRSVFVKSQNEMILSHLKSHGQLTPLKALHLYGVSRLAARVHELRNQGHGIKSVTERDPNGKQYAVYWIRAWDAPIAYHKKQQVAA